MEYINIKSVTNKQVVKAIDSGVIA